MVIMPYVFESTLRRKQNMLSFAKKFLILLLGSFKDPISRQAFNFPATLEGQPMQ